MQVTHAGSLDLVADDVEDDAAGWVVNVADVVRYIAPSVEMMFENVA